MDALKAIQFAIDSKYPKYETAILAQEALNALSGQIAILDESGDIIFTNLAWRLLSTKNSPFGQSIPSIGLNYLTACEQVKGKKARVASQVAAGIRQVMRGEMPEFLLEYPRKTVKDTHWYLCRVTNFSLEGKPHAVIYHGNITSQKLTENALRISAIAFETQEGIIVTDANGLIVKVNRAFTNITGYLESEVIGQNPRFLNSGHHGKEFYASMWADLDRHGVWKGEIWNRRKSGETYSEYMTITAVKDQSNAITNYVATLAEITMSAAAAEVIKGLAFYDSLTQLPNRRLLLDRLNLALASSALSGEHGALLIIDLDDFKTLNDTLGHGIGDLLLQQVAERLTSCIYEGVTTARIGGDEFVVLLEGLRSSDVVSTAQAMGTKILNVISQPYTLLSYQRHSNASIGITLFCGEDSGVDTLLRQADIALYQAKKAGRNTMCFFDAPMQEFVNARACLERELRRALAKQQFQLYYQVQVNQHGVPIGAEVLIRWKHPDLGLVSPAQFIPLAEETGLIISIGLWVLDEACAQIKVWQENKSTQHLTLSVNVSSTQFREADFVIQVQKALDRHKVNAALLKLELTENLLLENVEDTIVTMTELRKSGVRFSLDDFGTGYSSLQYLKRLPISQLKIDQSFVRDLAIDPCDRAIVRTIIGMAQSLNLEVIAEGVENDEQRQYLMSESCALYQGYLFGKPVPIHEFERAHLVLCA